MFAVEKNVPFPPERRGRKPNTGITGFLRNLEVGDSFVINTEKVGITTLRSIASRVKVSLTAAKINDAEYRIWRRA